MRKIKRKGFVVVGLGVFGRQAACALFEGGANVLAIDQDQEKVEGIRDRVTRAVSADATDEEAMKTIGAYEVDVAIIALGKNFDVAIIATQAFRERDIKYIIAQVDSQRQGKALRAVGATDVIFPERDAAYATIRRLLNPNLTDQIPVNDDIGIIELECPHELIGKTIDEPGIRKMHSVSIVAVRQGDAEDAEIEIPPDHDMELKKGSTIYVLGRQDALSQFARRTREES